MKKLILFITILLCIACKKSSIEKKIIANNNEYWEFYNYEYNQGAIYFQFKENGSHDKYLQYINEGFKLFNNDGDIISGYRTWSIKNDSTFVWDDEEYKIEKISDNEIILSYIRYSKTENIGNQKYFILLNKWRVTNKGPQSLGYKK
ncbi:hypothetical protein [Flavobacterium pokkalii]|nr:hypothetical protein [Flavobacterium pokkalii]